MRKNTRLPQTLLPDPTQPVLIAGPTASGKSALALQIAEAQGRVIINADALQVYDMWQILTARPDASEMARVPHYLYGCVGRDTPWSTGHWLRATGALLAEHPTAVIVGGTGLYFRALTEGLAEIPPTPQEIRARADAILARHGPEALLAALDPQTLARIDTRNPARIQRAWEVQATTGRGMAAWQDATPPPLLPRAACTAYVLRPEVDWLNSRIDQRFHQMLRQGALDEVRAVRLHWAPHAPWAAAIGAKELVAALEGQISWDEAANAATLASRQYAKRQRTWFRTRMTEWHILPLP